jgi:phage FluMu gp28-like protein
MRKDPRDDPKDFGKTIAESTKRANGSFINKISDEVGYIEELTETNLEPTRLYSYQKSFMLDRSKYRHANKSRQIGMSYGFSSEGFAKSQLLDLYTGIFVSYNQEEANEKILYARTLDESTPYKYKKKLVVDRVTALEWEGRTWDGKKTRARLISHPQREPRGKGFNTDVFLDEIAHYQWQENVYIAAVPIVTRGLGQLALASSPLGKSGLFFEIGSDIERYNMYSRHQIYWWNNPDFLSEDALRHGLKDIHNAAIDMETSDRVLEFGSDAIIQAYNSMLEEFFQQEYELKSIDESVAYFPMSLINQCTFDTLRGLSHIEEGDEYGDNPIFLDPIYPDVDLRIYDSVEELSHAVAKGIVSKRLFAVFAIGRNEDCSEIVVVEEIPEKGYLQILRLMISMKNVEFKSQFDAVVNLFGRTPILKMKIDYTGMGRNLGEDLERRYHSRIQNVTFNNENKSEMATNLKLRMEDQAIAYPNDRKLIRQVHSIKRKVTENANVKFDVDPSEKRMHHGDKFWALALASSAGEPAQMHRVRLIKGTISETPNNSKRLVKIPNKRMFNKTPTVLGVNYKKLPPPPMHDSEFIVHDAIANM